jgi:hypothetical protein
MHEIERTGQNDINISLNTKRSTKINLENIWGHTRRNDEENKEYQSEMPKPIVIKNHDVNVYSNPILDFD